MEFAHHHHHTDVLRELEESLAHLRETGERLMASAQDLGQSAAAVHDAASRVNDAASAAAQKIADLEAESGGKVDPADLDAVQETLVTAAQALDATADALNSAVAVDPSVPVTPAPAPEPAPAPAAFVAKVDGESYADYVARAQAAGVAPVDEGTWNSLPVG